ncbi:MAG TPA: class I SAM-dependent methyltransferase [Thermoanaerobaculia bacterium]|nr:class I SAM-dependent methyltransferase [Thermoanaerobaculia bacterium]
MNLKGGRPEKFGRIGSFFYRRLAERALAPMHRRIAEEVPVDGGRLLDVGCGPAALTREIARSRPALSVLGVDPSADMIRQARRSALPPNVELRVASPATAGLSDEIDHAMSVLSFHHWEEPVAELTAIHRALRPGGRLWLYEPNPQASNSEIAADRRPMLGFLRLPALDRWMERGHGFTAAEIERVVRPAVARTPFRDVAAVRSGSCWRLELEK